jgi:hypothetical protein
MHVRRKRTPATTSQRSLRRNSRSTFSTTFFLQGRKANKGGASNFSTMQKTTFHAAVCKVVKQAAAEQGCAAQRTAMSQSLIVQVAHMKRLKHQLPLCWQPLNSTDGIVQPAAELHTAQPGN